MAQLAQRAPDVQGNSGPKRLGERVSVMQEHKFHEILRWDGLEQVPKMFVQSSFYLKFSSVLLQDWMGFREPNRAVVVQVCMHAVGLLCAEHVS